MSHKKLLLAAFITALSAALSVAETTDPASSKPIEPETSATESSTASPPPENTAEEVIVTATRTPQEGKKSSFSFAKMVEEDIKREQLRNVTDVVSTTPSVYLSANGPDGGFQNLSIRGNRSDHSLITSDGVRQNTVMFPGSSPFLAFAPAYNLEDIEVVRGPQSTLYGSEAIAGVVAVNTLKGSGTPKAKLFTEMGSFNTYREGVLSDGAIGNTSYSMHYAREDAQNQRQNNDVRADSYSLRVDQKIDEDLTIWATARGTHAYRQEPSSIRSSDYQNNDINDYTKIEQNTFSLHIDDQTTEIWQQKVTIGNTLERYDFVQPEPNNGPGPFFTNAGIYIAKSANYSFDWQNNIQVLDNMLLTAGATIDHQTGHDNTFPLYDVTNDSLYLQDQWEPLPGLNLVGGMRYTHFELAGDALTYRFAGSYLIEPTQTKLRASYGTAFKAPGFTQLYSQNMYYLGNRSLKPESSEGWDAGIDQYLLPDDKLTLSVAYFENSIHDLLAIVVTDPMTFASEYQNRDQAKNYGVESAITAKPCSEWTIRASYTWQESTVSTPTTTRRPDVPRNLFGIDTSYQFFKRWTIGTGGQWVIGRETLDYAVVPPGQPNVPQHDLGDYFLLRAYSSVDINDHVSLFVRGENLLDQKFDATLGYPGLRMGFYGGAEIKF